MSVRCNRPIELAVLVDYWFEERAGPEDEALELDPRCAFASDLLHCPASPGIVITA